MTDLESQYDASIFERPSVTVDIVLFTIRDRKLNVLLVRRGQWPFEGCLALPGGFVRPTETLDDAARRELEEETGVDGIFLEQMRAFGDPGRDPRTWVITVSYTALLPSDKHILRAGTDAADAMWQDVDAVPTQLAFDHSMILNYALVELRRKVLIDASLVKNLVPQRFTLTRLQEVYEILLGRALDKRNFRKWVQSENLVRVTEGEERGAHRPAKLYEFELESVSPL
jgi:8-oxo-dGTP diphosphatase